MKINGVSLCVGAYWAANVLLQVDSVQLLSSLPKYEEMRLKALNSSTLQRVHNFDILSPIANLSDVTDSNHRTIGLCHVVDLNYHSMIIEGDRRINFVSNWPLEATAALALAYEHLNTGDGTVVKEVGGLDQKCNLRFTTETRDTEGREGMALDRVIEAISRKAATSVEPLPCAFTGAFGSSATIATAPLTGQKGYPQMGHLATTTKLDDKQPFPLFGRVMASGSNFGPAAVEFLYHSLNVRHLGVIYVNDVIVLSFVDGFLKAAKQYPDFTVKSYSYAAEGVDNNGDDRSIAVAVDLLAKTNFRFFLAIIDNYHYNEIIEHAIKAGIAGTSAHNWFTSNSGVAGLFHGKEFDDESPIHRASVGVTTISIAGSLPGVGRYDQFHEAWSALGRSNETMKYLQSLLPAYPNDPGYDATFSSETFSSLFTFTPIVYDTAIAIGLAACAGGDINQLDGTMHYKTILNTTFVGATGRVEFDPITGTRSPVSTLLSIENLVVREDIGEHSTSKKFVNIPIGRYTNGIWNQSAPLTFNDGSTTLPLDLPELIVDYNYIGAELRSAGMTMALIVVLSSAACATWTKCKVDTRIVRASQPFFLNLICLGTALMGLSIVALGIDDEISGEFSCNIACMAFPWLLSLGWVFVFSALFTKTHRVNKVFNQPRFKRVTVTITDVMKPMTLLLAANVIVLTTMTILSPLEWVRQFLPTNDEFGRPIESKGFCTSDNLVPYLVALAIVDLGAILITAYEAYIARNISLEFAESDSIGRAIGCICIVAFLALPIVYIAEENNQAYYFVICGVVFIIGMATLSVIFLPKMFFNKEAAGSQMKNIRSFFREPSKKIVQPGIKSSYFTESDASDASDFGARVIDHPKLRDDMMERNRELKEQLALLHGIFDNCTDPQEILDRYATVCAVQHGVKEGDDQVIIGVEQSP